MPIYNAPTRDTRFVVNELLRLESYGNLPGFENAGQDMTDAIIDWAIAEGAGRVATPRDQAKALAFLGSDLAGYVNGVNLLVDGGFTAAMTTGQVNMSALAGR